MRYNTTKEQTPRIERSGLEANMHSRKGSTLAGTLFVIAGTAALIAGSLFSNDKQYSKYANIQYGIGALNYVAAGLNFAASRKRK